MSRIGKMRKLRQNKTEKSLGGTNDERRRNQNGMKVRKINLCDDSSQNPLKVNSMLST